MYVLGVVIVELMIGKGQYFPEADAERRAFRSILSKFSIGIPPEYGDLDVNRRTSAVSRGTSSTLSATIDLVSKDRSLEYSIVVMED